MVSEWEKEQLGRLTLRNLKAVPQQENNGRMTHQNLISLKGTHQKTETREVRVKLFFERLKMGLSTGLLGLFVGKPDKKLSSMCELYGHKLPPRGSWSGRYPGCVDCGTAITDHSDLRGAVTKEERAKFRSV